jgi:hypothetical protein
MIILLGSDSHHCEAEQKKNDSKSYIASALFSPKTGAAARTQKGVRTEVRTPGAGRA